MAYDGVYRILSSRTLAVGTSGAVVASTASVSAQTRVVELCYVAAAAASAGVRFMIGEVGSTTVNSLSSPLLPPGITRQYLISPGQQIAALSNDASAVGGLSITELGK